MGQTAIQPSPEADRFTEQILKGIRDTLEQVRSAEHLPAAIHAGLLGSREDGAYPGTFGKGTVA
jgi:hypothetical protein